MSFLDLVSLRQSCRSYLDKPVEREKILRCLEAARLAPSACNAQPWHFLVIENPTLRSQVAQETFGKLVSFNHFTMQAPLFIIIVSEPPNLRSQIGAIIKNNPYYLIDLGIAAEHFCLQATEEGLGTCMLGWFDEKSLKKVLKIPFRKRIHLLISTGYPAISEIRPKKRKIFEEMASFL